MNTRTGKMFQNLRINLKIGKRPAPKTFKEDVSNFTDHEDYSSDDSVKDPTFSACLPRRRSYSSSSASDTGVSAPRMKRKCNSKTSGSVLKEKPDITNPENVMGLPNEVSTNFVDAVSGKENLIQLSQLKSPPRSPPKSPARSPPKSPTRSPPKSPTNTPLKSPPKPPSKSSPKPSSCPPTSPPKSSSSSSGSSSSSSSGSSSSSSSSSSEDSEDDSNQIREIKVSSSNGVSHTESSSSPVYGSINDFPNSQQIEIPSSCNSVSNSEDDDDTNTLLSATVRQNTVLNDKPDKQGKLTNNIVPCSDDASSSHIDMTSSHRCHNDENDMDGENPSEENQLACNEKRTRKRKAAPENWIRNTAKRLRNSGKSYTSRSNRVVPEKTIKPPCTENCKQNCSKNFTETQRKIIFDNYWEMGDLQRQREYILRHISPIQPKYSYKVHNCNRGHNNAFYLTVNLQRIRVCKIFFKATLDISDRAIKTVVHKTEDDNDTSVLSLDKRGKHTNHRTVDPEIKDSVREHINSIPRVESHYCRACTTREYIDGGKSIAELHRDYVKQRELKNLPYANYLMYNHIFKEQNISFHQPKKDQCEDCVSYANSTEKEKEEKKDKFDAHINEKMLARTEKDKDKKHTSNTTIVSVYDLQATMPCPKGDVSTFYYLSKLNVYNFTVCNIKDNNVSCYVWHEGEARRGVAEIGTCVLKYIEDLKVTATQLNSKLDLIFYSDNCTGQHKNHFMIALYVYVVNHFEHINSITHKFLIKGHTQNEGDSAHSVIERQVKSTLKSGPIYSPDQYYLIIRNAKKSGKPYKVTEMIHPDFIDIKHIASVLGKNFTKNTENNVVKLSDIKIVQVTNDEINRYSFSYKTSFSESETYKKVMIDTAKTRSSRSNNDSSLKQVYQQRIPVAEAKKKGLLELIAKNIVPRFYSDFYENL